MIDISNFILMDEFLSSHVFYNLQVTLFLFHVLFRNFSLPLSMNYAVSSNSANVIQTWSCTKAAMQSRAYDHIIENPIRKPIPTWPSRIEIQSKP